MAEMGEVSAATAESDGKIGELMRAPSEAWDQARAIVHESSENVTAVEGTVVGSGSARAEEDRRARVAWLEQLRRQCASEEEFETARSQPTWTELASTSSCSANYGPSSADLERLRVENQLHFQRLVKEYPLPHGQPAPLLTSEFYELVQSSPFFFDFGGRVEVGRKIGGGGQAEIYEAIFDGKVEHQVALKVFRSDASLADIQRQWVAEIGSTFARLKRWLGGIWVGGIRGCCFVKNGTLLKDGRFAFLMERFWGDLRKAIDLQIVKDTTHHSPPFPLSTTIYIMGQIVHGMRILHGSGVLHRDLKAANVLLTNQAEKVIIARENFMPFDCHVADFESCEGVMGTGFWRAPEILRALKNKVENKFSDPEIWTEKVDVYSYAMTCYEVLTGCIPFQTRAANDYDGVIGGERPPLPDYVDPEPQELLRRCWHSEPSMRPTFAEIQNELQRFVDKRTGVYKRLPENDRDAEAKQWLYMSAHNTAYIVLKAGLLDCLPPHPTLPT